MIVTAVETQVIEPKQAIDLVKTLQGRPDIWLSPSLCETVIKTLTNLG